MNLIEPIFRHAAHRPSDVALILPDGQIRWRQFAAAIGWVSGQLHAAGLRAGDCVGLTFGSALPHLLATLALARLGVAHVALPPAEPPAVRAEIARRLRLSMLIVDSERGALEGIAHFLLAPPAYRTESTSAEYGPIDDAEALTWLILQSSGTTGRPKFSALTHAGAMARFRRYLPLFDAGPGDVFWAASGLDFVVAKQRTIHALQAGAAVCLPGARSISMALLEFLRASRVSLACGTPTHLHRLLDLGAGPDALPSLRAFEVRSATISEKLRRSFSEGFSRHLFIVYATNEGEALSIASPVLQRQVPDTVGRATGRIELEVVDAKGLPLPPDRVGEVRVRGPGVVDRYLDDPEASARSFRDGWFHPGDLALLTHDGALVLQGRSDDMMIFDGVNLYPAEIERVLSEHPAVREVAAFALRDGRLQDVPAAAVILRPQSREPAETSPERPSATSPLPDEQALIDWCLPRLGYRHPRRIFIVDDFPRNAMGKVLRRELAANRSA
jgi:acyl-CoA synthetase (AMP-forming)/AMP-acid ligase II